MIGVIKADINELRNKIIKLALQQHHKEYVHGNHGPNTFDCAGFVWYIYNEILDIDLYYDGYGLSTTTRIMTSNYGKILLFEKNNSNKNISVINKGDVLFFHTQSKKDKKPMVDNKYPGHCGIYLGNNRFIHCTTMYNKRKVIITNFTKNEHLYNILVASKDIISEYEENNIKRLIKTL